jgi:biopolymer transport protein ExbB
MKRSNNANPFFATKIRSYLLASFVSLGVLLVGQTPLPAQDSAFQNPPSQRFQARYPQSSGFPRQGPTFSDPNAGQQLGAGSFASNEPLGRVASLPQDGSSSDSDNSSAAESAIPMRNLLQIFSDGGLLMYPIAICSFVLTIFIFERLINLRAGRVIPRPFVKRLIEQLEQQQIEPDDAIELCNRNGSPIANIVAAAVKRYGRPAVEVEQAVLDEGERETNQLRRFLRLLNGISNVTPLLGLLGTVLGMIEAFNTIATADAMGRPEMLAGGIGQALITTAAGLTVAIPAYMAYMFFMGRTDRLTMEMDLFAQQVVDTISAEALEANGSTRSRSRKRAA